MADFDAGRRAFILGNGPSLRETPLKMLVAETTFAMNRIHLRYDSPAWGDWRPTYYLAFDWTGPTMIDDILCNVDQAKHTLTRADRVIEVAQKRRHFEWPPKMAGYMLTCGHVGMNVARGDPPFLPTAWHLPVLCGFGGTVHTAVQVAVFMGFNPIYLLGCDLGFKDFEKGAPDPNHFDPAYGGWDDFPWHERDETLLFTHALIERECRARGVDVFVLSGRTEHPLDGIHRRATLEAVLS